ncbi:PLP-dependent transferase [Lojkania enalia]|uniref:PLP-dependent transferase n=1 Tax=Lojkania enalia TaxID=147567 RepID=A0A9P4N8J6_9PLEO|nr:PLP-dependent transferase [Didymosphaeria enalia]
MSGKNEEPTSYLLHRHATYIPPRVIASSGCWLELEDGRKVFDGSSGAAVACLGHGNDQVKEAINRQLDEVAYIHSGFFESSACTGFAKELVLSTNGKMAQAFLISSGSEAMEAAIKLAIQYFVEITSPGHYSQRKRFIARRQSYHGTTLGALSMGGHKGRRKIYERILMDNFSHVSPCNPYRGLRQGESVEAYIERLAKELDDEFRRVGPNTVAAFVAEPIVGAALGFVPAVPGYFKAMKEVCDKHGALLIFDEVMVGMGRSGTLHAWEQEGVVPDIQTIGKGLGGGYIPISGILIGHRVSNALSKGTGQFAHGQTYQSHAIACAGGLAVQQIIRKENLVANVSEMGNLMVRLLKERLQSHPYVGDIRGKGLAWAIEFVQDKQSKEPFKPELKVAERIHRKALEGPDPIALYHGSGTADGDKGDHIMISPPFIITEEEVEFVVKATANAIEEFFDEYFPLQVRATL